MEFDTVGQQMSDTIDPIIFSDYQEAKEYAESGYWVNPISFSTQDVSEIFFRYYRASDWATSGKVHYSKRNN